MRLELRSAVVGVVVGFAVAAVGCGPSGRCSAATCPSGCCDASGMCAAGTADQACGANGVSCTACGIGNVCRVGFCSPLSTSSGSGGGGGASGGGSGGGGATGGGSGGGGGQSGTGGGGGSSGGVSCATALDLVDGSGGCRLRIVGPANCTTLSFSAGFVELAWTTEGTFCEGPHRVFIAGHPASTWEGGNAIVQELTSTNGSENSVPGSTTSTYAMTRNIGGYVHLTLADLRLITSNLTSTTGQYHWGVAGFYDIDNGGSRAASRTFTLPAP
ncbi:MAG: hypothetical protein JNG84_11485 [Archangium sp.]|nr:hypothetical protein [Archangium sp.]